VNETLARAVQGRRVVVFLYDGLLRTVEPHALGLSSAGDVLLSGYQTAGFSHSSEQPGWRLYRLDRLQSLSVTPYTFAGRRPGFNPEHSLLNEVLAMVPEEEGLMAGH
jgi:predicted DNA-binding transcriptional regulator YafY